VNNFPIKLTPLATSLQKYTKCSSVVQKLMVSSAIQWLWTDFRKTDIKWKVIYLGYSDPLQFQEGIQEDILVHLDSLPLDRPHHKGVRDQECFRGSQATLCLDLLQVCCRLHIDLNFRHKMSAYLHKYFLPESYRSRIHSLTSCTTFIAFISIAVKFQKKISGKKTQRFKWVTVFKFTMYY